MARAAELEGVPLRPGDHVCGLFFGWFDRDELMSPFVRAGLDAGDSCIVVVDRSDPVPLVDDLGAASETEAWLATGQLQLITSSHQGTRCLHHDEMLSLWRRAVAHAGSTSRSGFVRVGGEVSWWTPNTTPAELARYEAELNRCVTKDMAVLCLYDLSRFSSDEIIDAVVAHPVVLVGDRVIENPWYLPPDEYRVGGDPGRQRDRPTMDDIDGLISHRAGPPPRAG
jgi:hypothetical protein